MFTLRPILTLVTTAVALLGILLFVQSASAQTTCDVYNPSISVPTGYGASYNVFNTSEMMISILCNEDQSITVTSGNNDPLTYIYNQGYRYDAGAGNWVNFTYSCSNLIADAWCVGSVSKTLTNVPTSGTNFLVSYTCQWSGSKWNCGCSNSSCSTHSWQLQGWTPPSGGTIGGPGEVTNIDFENRSVSLYTEAMVDEDFRSKANQINNGAITLDPIADVRIVSDPDGTRGKVLRSTFTAGDTYGRMQWRDHFSRTNTHLKPISGSRVSSYPKSAWAADPENGGLYPAGRPPGEPGEQAEQRENDTSQVRLDEVYFAVDMRLDANWQPIPYHKLWGIGAGSPTQASHGPYLCPHEEGYYGLTTQITMTSVEWGPKGNGAMDIYMYEADRTQQHFWLNRKDPTNYKRTNMAEEDFYIPPKGQWITVEVRSKLNTADKVWKGINKTTGSCEDPRMSPSQDLSNGVRDDAMSSGDKADGILQVWVTDSRSVNQGGTGGTPQLMLEKRDMIQRWWSYLKYAQFRFRDYNNGNLSTEMKQYIPQQDQDIWFDNIRVSSSPITH